MKRRFDAILTSFHSYVVKEKIEIKNIKWLLKNAVTVPTIFKGTKKSSPDAIDSLTDTSSLMEVIVDYCSFFNFDLLENIFHVLDFEEGKELMKAYKKKFNAYVKSLEVTDCPCNLGILSSDVASVTVLLDEGFRECELFYLDVLKEDISKILGIKKELLIVHKIFPGSVFVVFHMPISTWREVDLSDEMIESFKKLAYRNSHVIAVQFTLAFGVQNSSQVNRFEMERTKPKEIKCDKIPYLPFYPGSIASTLGK